MASRSSNRSDDTIVTFGRASPTTAAVILAMNSGLGMFSGVTVISGCAALNSSITDCEARPLRTGTVKVCQ